MPRGYNRPGFCSNCHAPILHPRASCPLCPQTFGHITGLSLHVDAVHGLRGGTRVRALALDVARAQVRGWPTEPSMQKFLNWAGRSSWGAKNPVPWSIPSGSLVNVTVRSRRESGDGGAVQPSGLSAGNGAERTAMKGRDTGARLSRTNLITGL